MPRLGCILIPCLFIASLAQAAPHPCSSEPDQGKRLACFDREFPAAAAPVAASAPTTSSERPFSVLSERWELQPQDKTGTFQFRFHAPIYLLPVKYSSAVNRAPSSPSRGSVGDALSPFGVNELEWDAVEAKFQLSFKVKAFENMVGDNGDLWFGYTQQAYWQVYTKDLSSPFRETNYAPELINTWRTDLSFLGMRMSMLNLGLIHQSNGKSGVVSRSWNRIYAQAGLERGGFSMLVRPWYRMSEDPEKDDNPDIENYVGRGDLILAYKTGQHVFSAVGRHSLRGGDENHGSLQFDWAMPITGKLKGHLQVFTGYGESLIDYNHRQTTFGLGISLAEWL